MQKALNQRDFFRIPLPDHPGNMKIIEVGQRPITTDAKSIVMIDASGSGLCMVCQEDLPIRRGVVALFDFELLGSRFEFRGTFMRKIDDLKKFEYGVRFIDVDEGQRDTLISTLGRLQVSRNRSTGA